MVLGMLPVPGRPTIWMIVGQGPIALALGAGGGCLDTFTFLYRVSPFFSVSGRRIGYRPCPRCSSSRKTCTCESRHRPRGAREVFRYARAGLSTG